MKATHALCTIALLASLGCGKTSSSAPPETAETTPAEPELGPSPVAAQELTAPQEKFAAELVFALEDQGLQAPESIYYYEEEDVYLVSNVNGDPLATDGNGFISKVSPDGKIVDLKFIDSADESVQLDAPKGMGISGGILYVADITWIRMFDVESGEAKGKIKAQGATFLNGVTTDKDGVVYVSDTGWKSGKEGQGYDKTGSDTVYRIDPQKVAAVAVAQNEELGNPNGLAANDQGLWAVNGGGALFQVTDKGTTEQSTKLAKGELDGIVALEDGSFLVSSWEGEAIYRGKPGGEFSTVVSGVQSPADIGYDSKRQMLLVPSMSEDRLLAYKLKDPKGASAAVAPRPGEATSDSEKLGGDGAEEANAEPSEQEEPASDKAPQGTGAGPTSTAANDTKKPSVATNPAQPK